MQDNMFKVIALFAFSVQGAASTRSTNTLWSKTLAARSIAAAGRPDPKCHSGVISLPGELDPQVCCAGYCGECTDYPTCASVNGQDSANACCSSKVLAASCDKGAPANVCLKSCTEAVPPCIMEKGEKFEFPDPDKRNALEDCNEAVPNWMVEAKNAVEAVEPVGDSKVSGKDQWKLMRTRNFEKSSVMRGKMEKLVGHLPDGFDFGTLDGDNNGGLSYDEVQKWFSASMPGGYDSTVAKSIYEGFDSNKDGQVDKTEMTAGMAGMGGPKPAAAFMQAMICVLHK